MSWRHSSISRRVPPIRGKLSSLNMAHDPGPLSATSGNEIGYHSIGIFPHKFSISSRARIMQRVRAW
jgi:hypothetical protein